MTIKCYATKWVNNWDFFGNYSFHSLGSRYSRSLVWVFLDNKSSQSFFSIKASASLSTSALKIFSKVLVDVAGFGFLLGNLYFLVSEMFSSRFLISLFTWCSLKTLPTPDFNVLWPPWHVSISLIKRIGSLNIDWIKILYTFSGYNFW